MSDRIRTPEPENLALVWEKQPEDTRMSYRLFEVFLELGPDRSLGQLLKEIEKPPRYKKTLKYYAKRYNWFPRAAQYDMVQRTLPVPAVEAAASIVTAKEQARLALAEHLPRAVRKLVELALNANGDTPKTVQLGALKELFDRTGLVAPKRVEHTGLDGGAIEVEAKAIVAELTLEQVQQMRRVLNVDSSD